MLRLGFVMNPYAGIGGPAGFKGSDLIGLQRQADTGEIALRAPARAQFFWQVLAPLGEQFSVVAAPGMLGADWLAQWNVDCQVADVTITQPTTAVDTIHAANAIVAQQVDLLLFVGGDGTARDIYTAVGNEVLVLGIPSGVKMHSGVYAINPQCAAEVVKRMLGGELIAADDQEVRDIDEESFRQGKVRASRFGEMRVPVAAEYVQAVKQGGIENEELVIIDIAEDLKQSLPEGALIVWAPGSTTRDVLAEFGHDGTLLGVDVLLTDSSLVRDVNAQQLLELVAEHTGPVALIVTAIGGQGHIIGRGNQQITPGVLERISREHLFVIAPKAKLLTLEGRPLLLDTGAPELDAAWSGWIDVITGYEDRVHYPVAGGVAYGG